MLVRALTGMEPDRWEAERRRGMTIDLGFAWMTLPSGEAIAFVDVPGHERFITNMLAGAGPAPAVMFVVAADEGWMPQSAEHLAPTAALGRLAARLPQPDPRGGVRLWLDRVFAIKGSGTVVTGTLQAGTVRTGDELTATPAMRPVRVRSVQSLGAPTAH